MSWCRLEEGDAVVVVGLAQKLGVDQDEAIARLVRLRLFALQHAKDGDLTAFDPEVIEAMVGWRGSPGAFIAGAVEARVLRQAGYELFIHRWVEEICPMKAHAETQAKYAKNKRERLDSLVPLISADVSLISADVSTYQSDRLEEEEEEEEEEEKRRVGGPAPFGSATAAPPQAVSVPLPTETPPPPPAPPPLPAPAPTPTPPRPERVAEPARALTQQPNRALVPMTGIVFPTKGGKKTSDRQWSLPTAYVDVLAEAFPGIDVLGECRKANAWLIANADRQKTAKGMPGFLHSWLTRTNDRGGGGRRNDAPPVRQFLSTWEREMEKTQALIREAEEAERNKTLEQDAEGIWRKAS